MRSEPWSAVERKNAREHLLLGALVLSSCQSPSMSEAPLEGASRVPNVSAMPTETPAPTATVQPEQDKNETMPTSLFEAARNLTDSELLELDIRRDELPGVIDRLEYSTVFFPQKASFFNNLYYRDGIRVKVKYNDLRLERLERVRASLARGLQSFASAYQRQVEYKTEELQANVLIGFHKDQPNFARTSISGWTHYNHPTGSYALGDRALIMLDSDYLFPDYPAFSAIPSQYRDALQEALFAVGIEVASTHEGNHTDGYVQDHDPDPLSFMATGHEFRGRMIEAGEDPEAIPLMTSPQRVYTNEQGMPFMAFVEQYPRQRDPAFQLIRLKQHLYTKYIEPHPGTLIGHTDLKYRSSDWETWKTMSD